MIEISHAQARFLIRQSLDARAGDGRRLPEEQWMALQAHLESCPECQEYNRQVIGVEKGLHHVLAARWQNVPGPEEGAGAGAGAGAGSGAGVNEDLNRGRSGLGAIPRERDLRRQRQKRMLGWARRAGWVMLIVLAVGGLITWNRARRMESPSTPAVTATPQVSPTPAPPAYFDGVVLYAGREPGGASGAGAENSEIFLLQSQGSRVEKANLTQNPAQDTNPVWSPDGEWIAFLSDRGGKTEVYVMTVAGSRVTQLSDEPDIAWEGPLAWSPDGQWLALPGKRVNQGDASWLYLVSMDRNIAAHPLSVPGSRGVSTLARFITAPDGSANLIYQQPAVPNLPGSGAILSVRIPGVMPVGGLPVGGLPVGGLPVGEQKNLTSLDESAQNSLPSGGFDANEENDAVNLVYLADSSSSSDIRSLRIPIEGSSQRFIMDRAAIGTVQDIALIPSIARVAYLKLDPTAGCWKINLRPITLSSAEWSFDGLCVDGGLTPGQWAASSAWGVVTGHAEGRDATPQLWAVHLPSVRASNSEPNEPVFYSLGDAGSIVGNPLVRPSAPRLEIVPKPENAPASPPPDSPLPDPMPSGKVVMSIPEGENSRIEMMDADGSKRMVVQQADAANTCPALSPDGRRLAYLSNRASIYPNLSQVFVRDLVPAGAPEVRLHLPNLDYAGYDCPVWSPDGTALAMVGHLFGLNYLAVFSVEADVAPNVTPSPAAQPTSAPEDGLLETAVKETGVYLTIDKPSAGVQPAWTPDSRSVYLGFPRRMGFPPVVNFYHWNGPRQDISSPGAVLTYTAGWEDILGLSVSPDGHQVALLAERSLVPSGVPVQLKTVFLQIYDRGSMALLKEMELNSYVPGVITNQGRFFWQPGGQVIFAYPTSRLAARTVSIIRFDPLLDTLQVVAGSADILTDWTVIGDWLLFASESGIWGSVIPPGMDSPSLSPRWLSGDVVSDLSGIGQ